MPDTPERLPQGTPEEIDEAISLIGRLSRNSKVRSVARDLLLGKKPDSILPLTASLRFPSAPRCSVPPSRPASLPTSFCVCPVTAAPPRRSSCSAPPLPKRSDRVQEISPFAA